MSCSCHCPLGWSWKPDLGNRHRNTIFLFHNRKKPLSLKKTSLWLLLHLPCHPHIHSRMHIWQNRKCLVICAFYCEYGDGTEDVAVVLETFSFKLKGFFLFWKRKIVFRCPFRKSGFQLQPNLQYDHSQLQHILAPWYASNFYNRFFWRHFDCIYVVAFFKIPSISFLAVWCHGQIRICRG